MSFTPDKEEIDEAEARGDIKWMRSALETVESERMSLMCQIGELRPEPRSIVTVEGHDADPDTPAACLLMSCFRLRELAASYNLGAWRENHREWHSLHRIADEVRDAAQRAAGYRGENPRIIFPYPDKWGETACTDRLRD